MIYLVDGDNLLGTWPGRTRSACEKQRLAAELDGRAVVVFDLPGRSADDAILAALRREPNPAEWTVVTSDRSLSDRCRSLGASTERSHEFRRRLSVR